MLPGAKAELAPSATSENTQPFCLGLSISYSRTVKANEVWQFFFFFCQPIATALYKQDSSYYHLRRKNMKYCFFDHQPAKSVCPYPGQTYCLVIELVPREVSLIQSRVHGKKVMWNTHTECKYNVGGNFLRKEKQYNRIVRNSLSMQCQFD